MSTTVDLLLEKGYSQVTYINKGGFGSVYKCFNKNNEVVAVKVIEVNNHYEINDGLREATQLMKLDHLNIVKVYDVFFLTLDKLVIEMEYLDYGNLRNVVIKEKIKLSENLIYKILQQSCNALMYLEEKQIIHRDIKLENIVVKHLDLQKEEIEIVIIDFGLVKSINSEQSMSIRGTIGYLAPELLQNVSFSFKSDIFALGVTLFRLMSFNDNIDIGQFCFFEKDLQKIKDILFKNIKNNNADYSDKLINIVLQMLEKEVDNRYSSKQILNEFINEQILLENNNSQIIKSTEKEKNEFTDQDKINLIGFSNQFEYIGQIDSFKVSFLNEDIQLTDRFRNPSDILIDNDLIYIVDKDNDRIVQYNLENKYIKQFHLNFRPSCIKLDKTNDTFLLGNRNYHIIYRFNKNFKLLQKYGSKKLFKSNYISITGIEVDESNGNVIICNFNNNKIQILTKEFQLIQEINLPVYDILLNNETNELIATGYNCIVVFSKEGDVIKIIEEKKENDFNFLNGIIYDYINKQYIVCDRLNNRIQMFNENFEFIKAFGTEGNSPNEFRQPRNLTLNYNTGYLYIVDTNNHCIKIYKYL